MNGEIIVGEGAARIRNPRRRAWRVGFRFAAVIGLLTAAVSGAAPDRAGAGLGSEPAWNRARQFINEFTSPRLGYFDARGGWAGPADAKPWRELERSAYIAPFLESGRPEAVRLANAIIENRGVHQLDMAHVLVRYRDKLSDEAAGKAENLVRSDVEGRFQEFRWKHFQGDNDNFQLMAAATVALWGRYTGERKHTEDARARLEEFRALLTRRGFASEFNSPAYLGLHLHPLALIAEMSEDEELRKLAVDLETRTWIDLLSHYHAPSGVQAGPSSRDYNFNIFGGGFTRLNLHLVLGDHLLGDWKEGYRSEIEEHGLVRAANRACVRYHCPDWLIRWTLNREYPFTVIGTADGTPSFMRLEPDRSGSLFHWNWKDVPAKDERLYTLPAWDTRLVTYMTEQYSLGTSQRMFADGAQCHSFVATMPATTGGKSVRDTVRIYARYVVNEHQPAVTVQDKGGRTYPMGPAAFRDAGRSIALQHEGTAMVLYRPHVIVGFKPTSLKTMVIIPNTNFGEGKPREVELFIGDTRVEDLRGESVEPAPVFVRIGETFLALHPLVNHSEAGVPMPRETALRIRPEGKCLGISFYNYQGEGLAVNPRQSALVGGGFVCEMGSTADHADFAAFRARFKEVQITDRYRRTVHSRGAYTREVIYGREGLTLATEFNPTTEGIRYQTINGKVPHTPQLEATGLPRERVPFLRRDD